MAVRFLPMNGCQRPKLDGRTEAANDSYCTHSGLLSLVFGKGKVRLARGVDARF
jgi:hypothetical protein